MTEPDDASAAPDASKDSLQADSGHKGVLPGTESAGTESAGTESAGTESEAAGSAASAEREPAWVVGANLVGAFAVASAMFQLASQLTQHPLVAETEPVRISDVATLGALLLAGVIGSAVPLRQRTWLLSGWLLSAAGLAGAAALYQQDNALPSTAFYPALGVVVALLLGGVLRAFGSAQARSRWAIAAGIAVGFVAGYYVLTQAVRLLRSYELSVAGLDETSVIVLTVLTALCGLVVLRANVSNESTVDDRRWEAVAGIAAAAVVSAFLVTLLRDWLEHQAAGRIGEVSEAQANSTNLTYDVSRMLIAVLIGIILLVVAYRRGGANLTRWVLVAFVVTVAGAPSPFLVGFAGNTGPDQGWVSAAALIGVAIGVLAIRRRDAVPWDAVAVVIALIGALVGSSATGLVGSGGPGEFVGELLYALGIGVALAVALGRAAQAAGSGVAWSLLLGFAVLQLVGPLTVREFGFFSYGPLADAPSIPAGPDLRSVFVLLASAVLLAGVWLIGRRQRA